MNRAILAAEKIYLDSNIFIYFVEGNQEYQDITAEFLEYAVGNGIPLITSEITVAECLMGAYKIRSDPLVQAYRSLFHDIELLHLIPMALGICERAARIGTAQRMNLIDAIHVASAMEVGCDVLMTNDHRIKSMAGLAVARISDRAPLTPGSPP